MMTDPIADMLTRIRNAAQAAHKWVDMPVSNTKVEIARPLQESHFGHSSQVLEDGRGRQSARSERSRHGHPVHVGRHALGPQRP